MSFAEVLANEARWPRSQAGSSTGKRVKTDVLREGLKLDRNPSALDSLLFKTAEQCFLRTLIPRIAVNAVPASRR